MLTFTQGENGRRKGSHPTSPLWPIGCPSGPKASAQLGSSDITWRARQEPGSGSGASHRHSTGSTGFSTRVSDDVT